MEELLRVIYNHWTSDDLAEVRALATGGLWANKAPQGLIDAGKETYGVYRPLPGTVRDSTTSKIEVAPISFTFYSVDADDTDAAMIAVRCRDWFVRGYDNVRLAMEDDPNGNARRMIEAKRLFTGQLLEDPDKGYNITIDYEFMYG